MAKSLDERISEVQRLTNNKFDKVKYKGLENKTNNSSGLWKNYYLHGQLVIKC